MLGGWKFISEERTRPTPNWTKAVASVITRHEDEAEPVSGPDPTDDTGGFGESTTCTACDRRRR